MTFRKTAGLLIVGALCSMVFLPVFSSDCPINTASLFELGVSVRALGMGGVRIAVADDESAVLGNPAMLPRLSSTGVVSTATRPFGAYNYASLGAAEPGWGISLQLLDSGRLEARDLYGNPLGTFRFVETGWILAGGLDLGQVSLGLQGKLYTLMLPDQAVGYSLSPSALFDDGLLTYGVVWHNLIGRDIRFSAGQSEPWERNVSLGVSWRTGSTLMALDFAEQLFTRGEIASVRMGIETEEFHPLVLRAGTHREGISIGASFHTESFRVDMAYVLHYVLPDTYAASITFNPDERLLSALTRPFRAVVEWFQ